jgi:hypothetical protein
MHKSFSNRTVATSDDNIASYQFKFPPKQNVIDALTLSNKLQRKANNMGSGSQLFVGTNPLLLETTVEAAAWKFNTEVLQEKISLA